MAILYIMWPGELQTTKRSPPLRNGDNAAERVEDKTKLFADHLLRLPTQLLVTRFFGQVLSLLTKLLCWSCL
jgi:hypothetical protein